MAISQYAAFAGVHDTPAGNRIRVFYADAAMVAPRNKALGVPPGHRAYVRVGWYWQLMPATKHFAPSAGPFTSSRKAYQHAMANACLAAKGRAA